MSTKQASYVNYTPRYGYCCETVTYTPLAYCEIYAMSRKEGLGKQISIAKHTNVKRDTNWALNGKKKYAANKLDKRTYCAGQYVVKRRKTSC